MTRVQAELLLDLVHSVDFMSLIGEISTEETLAIDNDVRAAIRSGEYNTAAIGLGRHEATDGLKDLFIRYSKRYASLAADRT